MTIFKDGELKLSLEYVVLTVNYFSSEDTGKFGVRLRTNGKASDKRMKINPNRIIWRNTFQELGKAIDKAIGWYFLYGKDRRLAEGKK